MDIQLLYTEAAQLLENGLTKDAYIKFINTVELSTQQLYGVKFVHQTIVSTPADYDKLLSTIRSSLTQLEHIVIQTTSFIHKTSAPPPLPPKPLVPPKPKSSANKRPVPPPPSLAIVTTDLSSPTPSTSRHISSLKYQSESPPPLPVSVTPIQATPTTTHEGTIMMTPRRSRANSSVTFADRQHTIPYMDDEEEEDDEEESIMNALKSTSTEKPSYPLPLPQRRIQQPDRSSAPSTTTLITNPTGGTDDASYLVIDPYDLVPAQTNTGESMALPISPTCTTDFYVPNIPAPPLLGMHRQLQQQLDSLLAQQQTSSRLDHEQHSASIATVRRLLNNVRTVYMSAMTVPTLLAFSPQLMAYQLTLIESAIFRAIPPEALQQHRAIAKQPHPNIVASTDFFNYLTRSIEHGILLPQEASHRAEVVHRWIKIATQCLALNNYQTLKAIVSALGTPPVQRLKRTWECIPKKRMNRLEVLTALMSEADNYSRYRQHIRTLVPNNRPLHQPIVPFLGVLIHDMTYVLTAKSTTADDPRAVDILNWVRTFQRAPPYSLRPPAHYIKKKNGFFSRQAQALQHYYTPMKTPSSPSTPVTTITSTPTLDIPAQHSNYFTTTPLQTTLTNQSTTSDPLGYCFSTDTSSSNSSGTSPGSTNTSTTMTAAVGAAAAVFGDVDQQQQHDSVAVEQQRITHYLLMRPWVNEKIIDELSQLREAPRRATGGLARTNSYNSGLLNHPDSMLSMTTSSSSSGGGRSTWDADDFPKSPSISSLYDDNTNAPHQTTTLRRSLVGSLWPWRKSSDDCLDEATLPPRLSKVSSSPLANTTTTAHHHHHHQHLTMTTTTTTTTPPPTPRRSTTPVSHHHRSASVPGASLS
ncbi:ras guanine nucleotide exchange factor domain-containing protein [Absidia repens]|uniref:Ras guanine nucleotide exchange factor domain-containing protein n=1 Tax=Absidia repens TaxID=90262 RepID=A0A1X2IXD5_9FUNG|nr:ras guanine nucleotide exchange factor domain-containing protein [Absidia repens]